MDNLKQKVRALLHNSRLIRYFIMAVIIVLIELASFQGIYLLASNYIFATAASFVIGVVLNWVAGRLFIFGKSHHHPAREFAMVLTASIGGLAIQLLIISISVQTLHLYPLIGKVLSILFSFFWNYWFRANIIYKMNTVIKS